MEISIFMCLKHMAVLIAVFLICQQLNKLYFKCFVETYNFKWWNENKSMWEILAFIVFVITELFINGIWTLKFIW